MYFQPGVFIFEVLMWHLYFIFIVFASNLFYAHQILNIKSKIPRPRLLRALQQRACSGVRACCGEQRFPAVAHDEHVAGVQLVDVEHVGLHR